MDSSTDGLVTSYGRSGAVDFHVLPPDHVMRAQFGYTASFNVDRLPVLHMRDASLVETVMASVEHLTDGDALTPEQVDRLIYLLERTRAPRDSDDVPAAEPARPTMQEAAEQRLPQYHYVTYACVMDGQVVWEIDDSTDILDDGDVYDPAASGPYGDGGWVRSGGDDYSDGHVCLADLSARLGLSS